MGGDVSSLLTLNPRLDIVLVEFARAINVQLVEGNECPLDVVH